MSLYYAGLNNAGILRIEVACVPAPGSDLRIYDAFVAKGLPVLIPKAA